MTSPEFWSALGRSIAFSALVLLIQIPIGVYVALEGFTSAVPREIDEIARLDGYGAPRFFWKILLPQVAPGIAITAFYCFMFSWIEFLLLPRSTPSRLPGS